MTLFAEEIARLEQSGEDILAGWVQRRVNEGMNEHEVAEVQKMVDLAFKKI